MKQTLTRRSLLRQSLALAGGVLTFPGAVHPLLAAPHDDFWRLDATAQADLVRTGAASPLELVEASIARIERIDPELNAVVNGLFDRARDAARRSIPDGPFRGVPWLLKDVVRLKGVVTTWGSHFSDPKPATSTSPWIESAHTTGLIPVGMSNTPEYGLLGTTESRRLGACRNPWETDHTPGGSSGGAAAAVAAGLVPIAHARDGGGSIRIPASCCGLFGLKASRARFDPARNRPNVLSESLCVSRSVRDSARLFASTEYRGPDAVYEPVGLVNGPADQRLRIALTTATHDGSPPHPEVEAAAVSAAELCSDLGHVVERCDPPLDGEAFFEAFLTYWAFLGSQIFDASRKSGLNPDKVLEPWTRGLSKHYKALPNDPIKSAYATFGRTWSAHAEFFESWDVILSPTLAAPPPEIGELAPTVPYDDLLARVSDWVAYTPVHNAMGTPAMSVPLGWSSTDLPIGIQFAAARGGERTLLELAYELEAAAPWASRWPALAMT